MFFARKKKEFAGWEPAETVSYETIWNEGLKDFIHEVLTKPAPIVKDQARIMKMYTSVFEFVNSDGADVFGLLKTVHDSMRERVAAIRNSCTNASTQIEVFATFLAGWRFWKMSTRIIHFIFLPVDSNWKPLIRSTTYGKSLDESILVTTSKDTFSSMWRKEVSIPVSKQIRKLAMDFLNQEHQGSTQNSAGLTSCMSCFTRELGEESVAHKFEEDYIEETRKFYTDYASKMDQHDLFVYVKNVCDIFDREVENARPRIRENALTRFCEVFDKVFFAGRAVIFESQFIPVLRRENVKEIRSIYHVILRANNAKKEKSEKGILPLSGHGAKGRLCKLFQRFVRVKIQQLIDEDAAVCAIKGLDTYERFAEVLLTQYAHFSMIVQNSFDNEKQFADGLEIVTSEILNSVGTDQVPNDELQKNVAAALAKYCDKFLRKRRHPLSLEDIEARQRGVVTLLRKFSGKDLFIRQYEKFFAQRAFSQSSVSLVREAEMVEKLYKEQGSAYVSRLRTMIQDCNANSETMESFRLSKYSANAPIEAFAVNAANWPVSTANNAAITLPSHVQQWLNAFDKFYSVKFGDRKLEHLHHLAHADVRYNITDSRSIMLVLSAYQVSILSLFTRNNTTIELGEIIKRCSMPKTVARRQLKPLIIHELLRTSDFALEEDTKLSLNPDFTVAEGVDRVSMIMDPKDDFHLKELQAKLSGATITPTTPAGPAIETEDSTAAFAATPTSTTPTSSTDVVPQQQESTHQNEGLLSDETLAEMVEKEHQLLLQAAVMRIMKRQKTLKVTSLLDKTIAELATFFQVTQPLLKTVLAYLKQLGFIEFDPSTGKVDYIP